jgi:DNA-binding IclR family transcriptional regulator
MSPRLRAFSEALKLTARDMPGAEGATMFAALAPFGLTEPEFTRLMYDLVHSGWVEQRGDCYFPGPNYNVK